MPINSDKPHLWKAGVVQAIDFYNDWFPRFASSANRKPRFTRTKEVLAAIEQTAFYGRDDHTMKLSTQLQ